MAYDKRYRTRVVEYILAGHTQEESRSVFKVSRTSIKRWLAAHEASGSTGGGYTVANRGSKKIDSEKLEAYMKEHPDAFLKEITTIPAETIAYVDETGVDECFQRDKCRAKRGVKVYDSVLGRKYVRTNIVAFNCCGQIIAPLEYSGTTDHYVFEMWFEKILLEQLPVGHTIVMDNASFHRKKVLCELAQQAEKEVLFLPAYSPDFNPIEKTWANLKAFLRNYAFRFDCLQDAVSDYFQVE